MKPHQVLRFLGERFKPLGNGKPKVQVVAEQCNSFGELCEHYEAHNLHLTQNIKDTMAVLFAAICSTTGQGCQLWLRVIGPPGALKSTLAEAVEPSEYVHAESITKGLITGSTNTKAKSLLDLLHGKTLFYKDATTLIESPDRKRVESEFRDAYDKVIRGTYRNGKVVRSRASFTVVMCGTMALRAMDDSILGARFLDCVILDQDTEDTRPILRRAFRSAFDQFVDGLQERSQVPKDVGNRVAPKTIGFIKHKRSQLATISVKEYTKDQEDLITAMAELISYARATVDRERGGDMRCRPQRELATRVQAQLLRFAYCISLILQPDGDTLEISEEALRVVRKVMGDSCYGFQYELILLLLKAGGLTVEQVAHRLKISSTHTRRLIENARELGIVILIKAPNPHGQGKHAFLYALTDNVIAVCSRLGMTEEIEAEEEDV